MEYWLDKWIAGQTERKAPKPEMVKAKFENQNGRCMYCGHKLNGQTWIQTIKNH